MRPAAPARCIAVIAVCCAASAARAEHMVEFQIQSSKLIELVQHRLLEEEVCVQSSFSLPLQSGQFVLDHVAFPGPVQVQRAGQQIQFVVPVRIYTKEQSCIYDPNCGATDYTPSSPLSPNLILDLNATVDEDNKLNLCVEFNSMKLGAQTVDLNSLDPALASSLGGLLTPKCSKVDVMKSLKKLLKSDRAVKQVGVSANQDLSRIAVRIELDEPANPDAAPSAAWAGFFSGQISPSASGMQWSLFMNQTLLKQALAARFATSISAQPDIEILQGPSASYTPLASAGAQVQLDMELEIDAGCPFNNIGIDPAIVTLHLFAQQSDPNIIKSHGNLFTDVVDADVVACAFSFGPFGIIGLPVFAAIAANEGPSDSDFPDECNQINEEEFECEQPITLPTIRLSKFGSALWATQAGLTMNRLHGHESGISMGGPANVSIGLPNPPKELLHVSDGGFHYGVQGGCSSLRLGWSGGFTIAGDGKLCSIQIIDDPEGVYDVKTNWSNHALGNKWIGDYRAVELVFPRLGSDYDDFVANPYPCRVVIRTSAGSRCVEFAGPDVASINDAAAAAELAVAKANCLKPFWFSLKYMELLWLVDPPPFDLNAYVRFDDPFVFTQNVTAQVTDVQVTSLAPVSSDDVAGGQMQFNRVALNVTSRVRLNVGAATAAPPVVSAPGFVGGTFVAGIAGASPGAIAGKTKVSERSWAELVRENDGIMEMTIEQPIELDLTGVMGDGSVAEFRLIEAVTQTIDVPVEQLPEGISELSFVLEIPVDRIAIQAETEPYELEYSADTAGQDPVQLACGNGACGVGGAGVAPFLMLAWMSMKTRRRLAMKNRQRHC